MTRTLSNTPMPDPAKRPAKPAPQPIHLVPRPKVRGLANAIDLSVRILFVALVVVVGVIFASLIAK